MQFFRSIADEEVRNTVYDTETSELLVQFANGSLTVFRNVPHALFRQIPRGSGASAFLVAKVITKYPGQLLGSLSTTESQLARASGHLPPDLSAAEPGPEES